MGAGDRLGLWLPNVPAWLAVFFACARLGAIAVAVNTRFKSHEVADIIGRSRCRLLVYWPRFRKIDFDAVLAGCDVEALRSLNGLVAYVEEDEPPKHVIGKQVYSYAELRTQLPLETDASRPEAGCLMFTTSGTTKAPKFVLHDQQTLIRHALDVAVAFGYRQKGAKVLVTAPLCGAFGFCNAMAAIAAPCPLVMYPTFDPVEAGHAVRRHGITHTNATDEMVTQMLKARTEERPFPSVCFFGYAAFSPALADLAGKAKSRGLKLLGLYGSSEMQALLARQDEKAPLPARALAGGRFVAAEAQVRARDPETGEVQAHGVAGELEFRAPSRMVGYFENEEANRAVITPDGWFRSSDLGYTTPDGGFVFLTRLGDVLRLSGFLVSPAEIEQVLQQHADIAAAQVVGADTPGGTKAVAFVILRPGVRFDEPGLIAYCTAHIARYKVPLRIQALAEFPVTPSANATKIQKAKLRQLAQSLVTEKS